jgi:hypothetical protein
VSTAPKDARSPDAYQIGEEFHQTVRRCRMLVRNGGFLLQLTQAELSDLIEPTSRPTRR